MSRRLKWSKHKAEPNLRKHDVSFGEATTAFDDPLFVVFSDPDHSVEENRYILIGEGENPPSDGSWWSLIPRGRRLSG
jgi:uncharacterized DUF497 family protein